MDLAPSEHSVAPTDLPGRRFVARTELERALADVQALHGDPANGFFGPGSVTWQVNRECGVFLGAGRAALLQLAHPWVATSLVHHSNLMHDAIGRFHSTFRVVYTMLFGNRSQALAASRMLYGRHTGIRGELPHAIGSHPTHEHYEANEVSALRWVYATLVDSAMLAYATVLPPISIAAREEYYAESKRFGMLCGLPADSLPKTWADFEGYMAGMLAASNSNSELALDENAVALGQSVLSGVGTWVKPPRWYRALTAAWLPPRFREAFGLAYGQAEQRSEARARRVLPRLYPWLPQALRFVGPYREAQDRLRGRAPGRLAQRNNQFWMGRTRLLFPELALPQGIEAVTK